MFKHLQKVVITGPIDKEAFDWGFREGDTVEVLVDHDYDKEAATRPSDALCENEGSMMAFIPLTSLTAK